MWIRYKRKLRANDKTHFKLIFDSRLNHDILITSQRNSVVM